MDFVQEVASVSKGDEDFAKALKDPFYAQIREALYSENTVKEVPEPNELNSDAHVLPAYHAVKTVQAEGGDVDNKVLPNGHAMGFSPDTPVIANKRVNGEIQEMEEEEFAHNKPFEVESKETYTTLSNQVVEDCCNEKKKEVVISSEVNQALGILEKAISMFREYGRSPETRCLSAIVGEKLQNFENNGRELKLAEVNQGHDGGNFEEMISHEANSFCSNGSRYYLHLM